MNDKNKKIKVLHLFANLNLGGSESRIVDIYRSQNKQSVENDFVIMTEDTCYFENEILTTGGVIHRIPNPRDGIINTLWSLYQLLKQKPKYDAIHAHTSYFSGLVVFIAWLAGIKGRVTQSHNQSLGNTTKANQLLLKIGRVLSHLFATTRFAVSKEAGDFLYGNKSYQLVANAFNYKAIKHKTDITPSEIIEPIKKDRINLVMVARFYPVKRHDFMLAVFSECLKRGMNVHLHLVGDGDLQPEIKQQANELGVNHAVSFWGNRNDVYDIMPLFDLFMMPSTKEGLGIAAMEAQAAGVRCLLSKGVPKEADIGLDMCEFLELEDTHLWVDAIERLSEYTANDKSAIEQRFKNKGYDIEVVRATFRSAYLQEH